MKTKLSISMDKELVKRIEENLAEGSFRSKSHIIEYALKEFLRKK
ncbi:MAG: ribbon-helix-helix domain-containing protein [Nanoarchaeota archaeon]